MNNILILRDNKSPHVEVITYPDRQHNVKVDLEYFDVKHPVEINCSIKKFSEFEVLLAIIGALRKNDRIILNITFNYLFGLRSDRAFEEGQPNYCDSVIYPLLCNLHLGKSIRIISPHNIAWCARINVDYSYPFYSLFLSEIPKGIMIGGDQSVECTYKNFHKTRKENGEIVCELSKYSLNKIHENKDNNIIIVDDLCDGGATFIAESKYLKDRFPNRKIYLAITHALFSKGVDHVANHFDHIYCTNSYQDISHPKVTQFDIFNPKNL